MNQHRLTFIREATTLILGLYTEYLHPEFHGFLVQYISWRLRYIVITYSVSARKIWFMERYAKAHIHRSNYLLAGVCSIVIRPHRSYCVQRRYIILDCRTEQSMRRAYHNLHPSRSRQDKLRGQYLFPTAYILLLLITLSSQLEPK
jgi:hypothetical protein